MNIFNRLKYIWNIKEKDIRLEKIIINFQNEMNSIKEELNKIIIREKKLYDFDFLLKSIEGSLYNYHMEIKELVAEKKILEMSIKKRKK